MLQIDITDWLAGVDPWDLSHSAAEGGPAAGRNTWRAALSEAAARPLISTPDDLDTFRDYTRGFGAWDDSDIDSWDVTECNALLMQLIAGDIREAFDGLDPDEWDWDAYYNDDNSRGSLCHDESTGRVYYTVSE